MSYSFLFSEAAPEYSRNSEFSTRTKMISEAKIYYKGEIYYIRESEVVRYISGELILDINPEVSTKVYKLIPEQKFVSEYDWIYEIPGEGSFKKTLRLITKGGLEDIDSWGEKKERKNKML